MSIKQPILVQNGIPIGNLIESRQRNYWEDQRTPIFTKIVMRRGFIPIVEQRNKNFHSTFSKIEFLAYKNTHRPQLVFQIA